MSDLITRRDAFGVTFLALAAGPVRVERKAGGAVVAYTAKVELGQGARTEITMAVAEELRVPLSRITLVMGDTALCPDDGGTWASLTTPEALPLIRKAAADLAGRPVTPAPQWRVMGTPIADVRGAAIVTGAQTYPSDLRLDGMLYARIARPPYYRAKLVSHGDSPHARLLRDGDLLAAVSNDPVAAKRAVDQLKCQWEPAAFPVPPSDAAALSASFKTNATPPVLNMNTRYPPLLVRGDARSALPAAADRLSSSYYLPAITHVPIEPRAALALWRDGKLEVRSGTQAPFAVRAELARALSIPETDIRVIATGPGTGFGSKQRAEIEIEAARVSRLAQVPVFLQWSREEEFVWAYHRPPALVEIESALDNGKLTTWIHRNYNAGAPGLMTPYDTPNISCEFHRTPSPIRQGSYRSLASVSNTFARESHIDEWAARLKLDPLEFRLRNISDPRLRAILERLRTISGGLACTIEKQARIALRAQVAIVDGEFRVTRLHYAGDYGAIVNPRNLRKQIEGALVQGLGGALFEEVLFSGPEQTTRLLSSYRVPRFSDTPPIHVDLTDRRDIDSAGAGEAAITLVAPAIANAVFQLSGRRLRALPLK